MVLPSTPGAPLLDRTRCHAASRFSRSHTSSISASSAGLSGPASPWVIRSLHGRRPGFHPDLVMKASGSLALGFRPRFTHESRVLLAPPDRSGLRPSFPARLICCSAFRRWGASMASPTARPTMPSADFCAAVRGPCGSLSSSHRDTAQTSRGKFDRLPRTPAGSTARPLMDMDFAVSGPLVRPGCLISGFCSSGRGFAPRFFQTPPRGDALALR